MKGKWRAAQICRGRAANCAGHAACFLLHKSADMQMLTERCCSTCFGSSAGLHVSAEGIQKSHPGHLPKVLRQVWELS